MSYDITPKQAEKFLQANAINGELLEFVRALDMALAFVRTGELLYFLEKPWKWTDEFVAWDAAGRPTSHSDEGWGAFADALS